MFFLMYTKIFNFSHILCCTIGLLVVSIKYYCFVNASQKSILRTILFYLIIFGFCIKNLFTQNCFYFYVLCFNKLIKFAFYQLQKYLY